MTNRPHGTGFSFEERSAMFQPDIVFSGGKFQQLLSIVKK
jgi:hypothetical protein